MNITRGIPTLIRSKNPESFTIFSCIFGLMLLWQIDTVAQGAPGNPSLQDFSESQSYILNNFISLLDGVPSNFAPDRLQDFAPYLPSNFDFDTLLDNYFTSVTYVNNYITTHGEEALWEHFGMSATEPHAPLESSLPECFAQYYYSNLINIVSVAVCCAPGGGYGCIACIAGGAVIEQILLVQNYDCLERYK